MEEGIPQVQDERRRDRPLLERTATHMTYTISRIGDFVTNFKPGGGRRDDGDDGDRSGEEEEEGEHVGAGDRHEEHAAPPTRPLDHFKRRATDIWRRRRNSNGAIIKNVAPLKARQAFVLKLAKGLLSTGAPSHRIEAQLQCIARVLDISAQFIHLPSLVLVSFSDEDNRTSEVVAVRAPTKLALGKLHAIHKLYRRVVHDEISVEAANESLSAILKAPPEYSAEFRLVLAFVCSAIICPMSFSGSFIDMLMSGLGGALLCFMQQFFIVKHPMYASIFELSVAFIMSFFARALATIPGNFFCYSAISSGAIVLILPGYLILSSALELGSKNMTSGSVRLVYAIIYALFLGFGMTLGSDLYFVLDPRARRLQRESIAVQQPILFNGTFNADFHPEYDLNGTFTFARAAASSVGSGKGCIRQEDWPWWQQAFPFWTLFILVPAYTFTASLWKGQPLRSRHLPVMVVFACCSYAANRVAKQFIVDRGDVTSAVGAFVLGLLGNTYSRIFRGTAFTSMITGVTFLVPSSLGYGGGLSFNGDLWTQGILLGLRMVQIAIGVTVGLFTSALVVYSFGSTKKTGMFAF
ncbi:DUF1212-domain-containing protein [Exidia glandulosa HHB12029]|uniref:DUF1212-domain-containing protein n=1 Tax=Exidia glandulosa HHB12029 TaxID=1314781 RepID=A0A165N6D5_EXIGL|nr:DUF1212-domain-containing protein [Exidia glandulosa HHB12029]